MKKLGLIFILFLYALHPLRAQDSLLNYHPKVLLVTAHPDDDALFSATVFKTTRLLGGTVDLALMTNGEGGYTYSTLGNYIYGLELDKEEVGRNYLPTIRKKELMAGGEIVGIRNYFFFDQPDFGYSLDVKEPLERWDTDWAVNRLADIMKDGAYDFVFLMLPYEGTHGHHKASAIIGLRAWQKLPDNGRPIVFETSARRGEEDPGIRFTQLDGFPETKVMEGEIFEFDRNQTFGVKNRMNYNIIGDWVIAEHKSQGVMQMLMQNSKGMIEQYRYLALNGKEGLEKAATYFKAVNTAQP
jgi:LmbE family N-acetylglucosaminyl deacetylase